MGTNGKVRFKLAWKNYRVGDVITPNGTLRNFLMANGFVVPVDSSKVEEKIVTREILTLPKNSAFRNKNGSNRTVR